MAASSEDLGHIPAPLVDGSVQDSGVFMSQSAINRGEGLKATGCCPRPALEARSLRCRCDRARILNVPSSRSPCWLMLPVPHIVPVVVPWSLSIPGVLFPIHVPPRCSFFLSPRICRVTAAEQMQTGEQHTCFRGNNPGVGAGGTSAHKALNTQGRGRFPVEEPASARPARSLAPVSDVITRTLQQETG